MKERVHDWMEGWVEGMTRDRRRGRGVVGQFNEGINGEVGGQWVQGWKMWVDSVMEG